MAGQAKSSRYRRPRRMTTNCPVWEMAAPSPGRPERSGFPDRSRWALLPRAAVGAVTSQNPSPGRSPRGDHFRAPLHRHGLRRLSAHLQARSTLVAGTTRPRSRASGPPWSPGMPCRSTSRLRRSPRGDPGSCSDLDWSAFGHGHLHVTHATPSRPTGGGADPAECQRKGPHTGAQQPTPTPDEAKPTPRRHEGKDPSSPVEDSNIRREPMPSARRQTHAPARMRPGDGARLHARRLASSHLV